MINELIDYLIKYQSINQTTRLIYIYNIIYLKKKLGLFLYLYNNALSQWLLKLVYLVNQKNIYFKYTLPHQKEKNKYQTVCDNIINAWYSV